MIANAMRLFQTLGVTHTQLDFELMVLLNVLNGFPGC